MQDRSRTAATLSKASSQSKLSSRSIRPSTGLRGHRAAAVGRGADTSTDDRSPSAQRASQRRHPPQRSENRASSRQRSHDELDFAVAPSCEANAASGAHHTPRRQRHNEASSAPTPPWAEPRKPLESL